MTKIACFIFLLFSISSKADEYLFSTFDYEPWGFLDGAQVAGIIPDMAQSISEESNISITMNLVPYPRMVDDLKKGYIDFSIFSRHPKHSAHVNYVSQIFSLNVVLLTRSGTVIDNLDELYSLHSIKSVGVLDGLSLVSKYIEDARINVVGINGYSKGLKMLEAKRIDAFITIDNTIPFAIKKLGLEQAFELPGYFLETRQAWLQVSKRSGLVDDFPYQRVKNSVEVLKRQGVFESILSEYLDGL